jgi:hypothetical protein
MFISYDMSKFDVMTMYRPCLHRNKRLINKCKYVLDKNDLNIVRLLKSEGLAVPHVRFERGTIQLKYDDWNVLVLHKGTLSIRLRR